jgi:hypothetical protein
MTMSAHGGWEERLLRDLPEKRLHGSQHRTEKHHLYSTEHKS